MKSFRVLQFNMQFGQGWDESDPDHAPINMTTTVAEIRRHNADIVFLQEVEHVRPEARILRSHRITPGFSMNWPITTAPFLFPGRTRANCLLGLDWRFSPSGHCYRRFA